ncbi:winged helix-turn-helix transcriptional regulator [Paludisphaera mucosa]|uniref:Helix-turn-helix domain-containing protein n=1 Tax=Paludisphaera mucosa TaxID=3030827 RepID=A0ABT6FKF6_9BACT|nr:helix-turn-helix domain-containing protein [Paludisphaera mucosa]MDG3007843.1 helix-turn-helix domain-containing protein [Paludisphaera mucosa]
MQAEERAPETLEGLPRLLGLLSGAWTLHILCVLHKGPIRFGALRTRLGGVSTKTLTERLRSLESEGLVSRHYEPTVPPQVTYALTEKMAEIGPVLMELERIAVRWYGAGATHAE